MVHDGIAYEIKIKLRSVDEITRYKVYTQVFPVIQLIQSWAGYHLSFTFSRRNS